MTTTGAEPEDGRRTLFSGVPAPAAVANHTMDPSERTATIRVPSGENAIACASDDVGIERLLRQLSTRCSTICLPLSASQSLFGLNASACTPGSLRNRATSAWLRT